ncbi:MAG: hypothetical protein ACT4OX_05295 [Actinomycetota bacterium]
MPELSACLGPLRAALRELKILGLLSAAEYIKSNEPSIEVVAFRYEFGLRATEWTLAPWPEVAVGQTLVNAATALALCREAIDASV